MGLIDGQKVKVVQPVPGGVPGATGSAPTQNVCSSEMPLAVRTQIGALKDALADAVDAGMRCASVGQDAAAMEANLGKAAGCKPA